MRTNLSVPEKHQKKIAIATLKAPDALVGVMGGMDKIAARLFLLKTAKWSPMRIARLEGREM